MKLYICLLIFITAFAFAVDPGDCGTTLNPAPGQPATDAYSITVINTFECPYAGMMLGLDYVTSGNYLLFMDNGSDKLWISNANDGAEINDFTLPWTTPSPFGIADYYPAGNQPHCNDFSVGTIWYGTSFASSYANPYSNDGRGMDCDGTYIWEAFGPMGATYGACLRMNPDGTGVQGWNLPGITTQLSGLTTYPILGSQGIAVTAYESGAADHYIWFYEFNGSSMDLLGSATLPSCNQSLGLAYADARDTYFWSFYTGGVFYISELEITETSLQNETWGTIKASF